MPTENPEQYKRYNPFIRKIISESPNYMKFKKPYIGMSNVVSMCTREFALQFKHNTTINFPLQTLFNFQTGFSSEHMLEFFLNDMAKEVLMNAEFRILADQVPIRVDMDVYTWHTGKTDQLYLVVDTKGVEGTVLLELKKMASSRYNKFKKHGYLSEEAATFQLLSCMRDFPTDKGLPVPTKGAIVGISLDPPDIWDYYFDWPEEKRNEILSRFESRLAEVEKVRASTKKLKDPEDFDKIYVPEEMYDKKSFQCASCSVMEYCRPEFFKTLKGIDLEEDIETELVLIGQALAVTSQLKNQYDAVRDFLRLRSEQILNKLETKKVIVGDRDLTYTISRSVSETDHLDIEDVKMRYPEIAEELIYTTAGNTFNSRVRLRKGDEEEVLNALHENTMPQIQLISDKLKRPGTYLELTD